MGELVLALRDDPSVFSIREGVLVIVTTSLLVGLGAWKLRTKGARAVMVLAGLAIGAFLFRHFTDVQTSVVIDAGKLTVTKLYSPGWSIEAAQLQSIEIRRMRTKDELVVVTTAGNVRLISTEGAERRSRIAEAIALHFGLQQTTSGSWIRP